MNNLKLPLFGKINKENKTEEELKTIWNWEFVRPLIWVLIATIFGFFLGGIIL